MPIAFPPGFHWGAATAAHQVEGGNTQSDFWVLEHTPGTLFPEPSGDACDHYHRYRDDLALLAALGLNAYRFSLEWARIEPEPGVFSRAALDHYRRMLAACREIGLTTCVTFHHFTSPRWLAADGGWERADAADRLARFCARAMAHLGDLIDLACTVNEPNLPVTLAVAGTTPEGGAKRVAPFFMEAARRLGTTVEELGPFLFSDPWRVRDVMLAAHRAAVDAIKAARTDLPVGLTLAMWDEQADDGGEKGRARADAEAYEPFLAVARADDFVGVQTYTRRRWGAQGVVPPPSDAPLMTAYGWERWPAALAATVRRAAAEARVPILVTENGIATDDDRERIAYVDAALRGLAETIRDGIDVRGYFYWSALDNFEWLLGYQARFGLIAVDRTTQRRSVRPSAVWLGEIARRNALPDAPHDA